MLTILIVDDEKLERNGIKFLLNKERADFRILEAANGKDAVGVLSTEHVDILFSDVKMPYMNGLELARQAKEINPDIEIVIFSGYNDFFYAKEALKYGVVDYVLKPVDPDEFHRTLERIFAHILQRQEKEKKRTKSKDYLTKYFLINYLFTGSEAIVNNLDENLKSEDHVLQRCTRMILVSSSNSFFDTEEEHFTENLKEEIQREFYYVNLDSNEALFLFTEKYSDYEMLAEHIYHFLVSSTKVNAILQSADLWKDGVKCRKNSDDLRSCLKNNFISRIIMCLCRRKVKRRRKPQRKIS